MQTNVTSITAHQLKILGKIEMPFFFDENQVWGPVYIVNDNAVDLGEVDGILSRNFLYKNKIYFRGKNDKLLFKGKYYPLKPLRGDVEKIKLTISSIKEAIDEFEASQNENKIDQHSLNVTPKKRVSIPPLGMTCIPARVGSKISGEFLFVPDNSIINANLSIYASQHKIEEANEIVICVVNSGATSVRINRKKSIGRMVPFNEIGVNEALENEVEEIEEECPKEQIYSLEARYQEIVDDEEDLEETNNNQHINFDLEGVPAEAKEPLRKLLHKYKEAFYEQGTILSTTNKLVAEIDTGNHKPVSRKPYKIGHNLLNPLKEEIKELLEQGIIEPAGLSPWNSPIILIAKKTEKGTKRRIVVDFTAINKITAPIHNRYPDITQTVAKVAGKSYYSRFDLVKAYHQILLDEASREKTSFSCEAGNFRYRTLPMGLKNSGMYFMRLIDSVFQGEITENTAAFIDDLLVHTNGLTHHLTVIENVLKLIIDAGLKLNPNKCQFFQEKIEFLSFEIDKNGYRPSSEKIRIIKNYPRPQNQRQIQMMIGLFGYFRRHASNFSKTAAPITSLLKKGTTFIWTKEQEDAFIALKEELCKRTMLASPDFSKQIFLYVDASAMALGGCLSQKGEDGVEEPLGFASRRLKKSEENYSVTQKEMLGIVWATKQFSHFLFNTHFIVYTDHKCLQYLLTCKNKKPMFERWALSLSEFNMEIRYIKGTENGASDALSRIICNNGTFEFIEEQIQDKYTTYEDFLKQLEEKSQNNKEGVEDFRAESPEKVEINEPRRKKRKTVGKKKLLTNLKLKNADKKNCKSASNDNQDNCTRINGLQKTGDQTMDITKKSKPMNHIRENTNEFWNDDSDGENPKLERKNSNGHKNGIKKLEIKFDITGDGTEEKAEEKCFMGYAGEYCGKQMEPFAMGDDNEIVSQIRESRHRARGSEIRDENNINMPNKEGDEGKSKGKNKVDKKVQFTNESFAKGNVSTDETESELSEQEDFENIREIIIYEINVEKDNEEETFSSAEESSDEGEYTVFKCGEDKTKEKLEIKDPINREEIIKEQQKDPNIVARIKKFKNLKGETEVNNTYVLDQDGALYYGDKTGKYRIVLPETLIEDTIKKYHESAYVAHAGVEKTLGVLAEKIYFKDMRKKVTKILAKCETCGRSKPNLKPVKPPMILQKIPDYPFQIVNCDYLGPVRSANDYKDLKYGLVIADRLTKWVEVYPVPDLTTDTLVATFLREFLPQYGLPEVLISDGGSSFASENFTDFCEELNFKKRTSAPYYPKGNSLAEKSVRETKQFIRNLIDERPGIPWYDFLPSVKVALRSLKNEATGYSPYELVYNGRPMRTPLGTSLKFKRYNESDEKESYNRQMHNIVMQSAKNNLEEYQNRMKNSYDKHCNDIQLHVGQKVYLKQDIIDPKQSALFTTRNKGPFKIIKLSRANATIQEIKNPKNVKTVSKTKLKIEQNYETEKTEKTDENIEQKPNEQNNAEPTASPRKKKISKENPDHSYNTRSKAKRLETNV